MHKEACVTKGLTDLELLMIWRSGFQALPIELLSLDKELKYSFFVSLHPGVQVKTGTGENFC